MEACQASCHGSKSAFYLEQPENYVFCCFFLGDSTGREDVRMGGVRVWGLTGDDEKEETEVDRRQKDVTYSNKRLRGVIGGLQMD